MGTGAFTSVEAKREARVQVSDDADALLGLEPCEGPNGHYVIDDHGFEDKQVKIDISESNATPAPGNGEGVNDNAKTIIKDMLMITNQGTQDADVWIEVDDDPAEYVTFIDGDGASLEHENNAINLEVGESTCVGLEIDTKVDCNDCELFGETDRFYVNADAESDD